MKRRKADKRKTDALFLALVAALILLILFFAFRTYHNYTVFRSHGQYFAQPDAQVQPWMTPHAVERRFNISQSAILQALNTTDALSTDRMTIGSICEQRRLNCTAVIGRLNALHD